MCVKAQFHGGRTNGAMVPKIRLGKRSDGQVRDFNKT